jgi:hypothetical protein|nr:MAG TPA: hypothetical protein [Caudoviricetes sp.]
MTSNLEQAAANLLNAINNPSPRSLTAVAMHRDMAQNELGVHSAYQEGRHVGAATVHALLEIGEQLRLANLISLARGALPESIPCEPDYTDVQEKAVAALVYFRRHAIPTGYPPVPEDYVTAHLLPDVAAALGIEPLDEQAL